MSPPSEAAPGLPQAQAPNARNIEGVQPEEGSEQPAKRARRTRAQCDA